jgi:hypothetical protein
MQRYPCPYLGGAVALSEERARHIAHRHPDLLPTHAERIAQALADADLVRRSRRVASARLFSRCFPEHLSERHLVVVVMSAAEPSPRHWVITAYQTPKTSSGEIEWGRS